MKVALQTSASFNLVAPNAFREVIQNLHNQDERYKEHLTLHNDYTQFECFLMADGSAGYALSLAKNLKNERELANVFSTITGTGVYAVGDAVARERLLWLSCCSSLINYYGQFGFSVTQRQSNWIAGKPDVLYMALRQGQ